MPTDPIDPMMRSSGGELPACPHSAGSLFSTRPDGTRLDTRTITQSTRYQAGEVAAGTAPKRKIQILNLLSIAPQTLFELSLKLGLQPHQISGRLSELKADGTIQPTGQTRPGPTGCQADVYELTGKIDRQTLLDALGYPEEIRLFQDRYERHTTTDQDPGVEYSRRMDPGTPGLKVTIRVATISCPHCGHPLHQVEDRQIDNKPVRQFSCGGPSRQCSQTWSLRLATTPTGQSIPCLTSNEP